MKGFPKCSYMQNYITNNIINSNIYILYVIAYFRYVNNTFIILEDLWRQPENMYNYLNNINTHILFLFKPHINKKFNVLDLTVTIINNKFDVSILQNSFSKGCYNTTWF